MKGFILGLSLAVALLAGYWAWPFVGLHDLAADLQARNTAALSRDVDFARLRRSLTEQIIAAYLRITGRAAKLGVFGTAVASATGGSVADPLISEIINPDNLVQLLNGKTVPTQFGEVSLNAAKFPTDSLKSAWHIWLNSEYWLDRFSTGVPVSAPPSQQFRIRMRLLRWHWRLTGIDLPEMLRNQLAQKLAAKFP
jgi:Protein of unknown function (DUF2939)